MEQDTVQQPNPAPEASVTANGTNPPSVATDDAKATQPTSTTSFDPEIQKFLDNQNIKTDNLQEAVAELARRNMKLRSQPKQEVADVLKEPEPKAPETQPSQPHTLSDMEIASVSLFVKQQYKDVTADADFYKAMIADGFKPTNPDGQINLKGVMSYAAYKQKLIDAEKAIASSGPQANQLPQPTNVPDKNKTELVQNMTELAAQNIIMFSNAEKRYGRPVHPQYEEAVKFIQKSI